MLSIGVESSNPVGFTLGERAEFVEEAKRRGAPDDVHVRARGRKIEFNSNGPVIGRLYIEF